MSVDRSMRQMAAAVLLVAAVFLAMNHIVTSAPLGEWWLPLGLLIVGLALLPNWTFSRSTPEVEAESLPTGTHSYSVSAQAVPRLQTMTIRPDPELQEYAVTVTNDGTGDILPFMEETVAKTEEMPVALPEKDASTEMTPVSPETPAPALEPEPAAEAIPVSPETPTPNAPPEPAVEVIPVSPETPVGDTPGGSDDLTRLSGIGAKSAAALAAAGISSFQKLANSSGDSIRIALAGSGVRLVGGGDVDAWIQQAAFAARGDWDGLKQFNASRKMTTGE